MTDVAERVPSVDGAADRATEPTPAAPPGPTRRRPWRVLLLVLPALLVLVAGAIAASVNPNRRAADVATGAPSTTVPASGGGAAGGAAGTTPPSSMVHQHDAATYRPLSPADQKLFSQQMAEARAVAARYPTVADAVAAGYKRAGPFAPGAGAHYVAPDEQSAKAVTGFDLEHPLAYLYSGTEPSSVLLGIMYYTLTPTAPEGFAGPNDVFHKHSGICLTKGGDGGFDTPFPVDADTTKEQCDSVNGEWMSTTGWMLHVWTAPGWESPAGVFSHDNPLVVCADGTATISNDRLNQGCKGT